MVLQLSFSEYPNQVIKTNTRDIVLISHRRYTTKAMEYEDD